MASKANARQVGGKHYQKGKGCPECGAQIQHWDFVPMHDIPYMEARIMAYLMRWRDKDGGKDLEKAAHFLEKLQEQQMKPKVQKGRYRETDKQKRAYRKTKNYS